MLAHSAAKENIPALKGTAGWAKQPADKANLLASTFSAKATLPAECANEFSAIAASESRMDRFLRIRVRDAYKILRDLDASSGTGPDLLPAKVLKVCASQLAVPVALLSRLCLRDGRWPSCGRNHWIHPLHKRLSRANPENYRGVHLTAQLSKVVERTVGGTFVQWLADNRVGDRQYAYSRQRSHRDVLAVNVCSWLLLWESGHSVGLYCSDVAGAFDRVRRERLVEKLRASGLPDDVVNFLASWLEERVSRVVVAGGSSENEWLFGSFFPRCCTWTCFVELVLFGCLLGGESAWIHRNNLYG